jgi:predicted membrane-bound spermidine synthase
MKLSLSPKLVEKLVWVPIISLYKTFIRKKLSLQRYTILLLGSCILGQVLGGHLILLITVLQTHQAKVQQIQE